ncbi:unnamed protein product [Protopolystoma xenopodis]|uniref:Uncharacterized protein n=1 Tax=Protopolystoma xenopodis TaxID=117903 RepID=A0A448WPM6_9PLAT|nr:unnamed protein product [Protopolystoma xenopodis]
MVPLNDDAYYDAGVTPGNVPSQWSDVGDPEYYHRGLMTRYVPKGLPVSLTKLRHVRTNANKTFVRICAIGVGEGCHQTLMAENRHNFSCSNYFEKSLLFPYIY